MSNRTFTWWRRFHSPVKLKKNQMWKGYPQLLQRIEFGEFEYCHLSEECLLEEELYRLEEIEIRKELTRSDEEAIQEKLFDRRKLKNKRVKLMMQAHLKKEHEILKSLKENLCKEFNMSNEFINNFFDNFDGNTRQLYYALRAVYNKKPIPSNEDIDKYPRAFMQQPRHVLKHEHRGLNKVWKKVVKQNKIWNAHGITD